jgi:hypothetical protein
MPTTFTTIADRFDDHDDMLAAAAEELAEALGLEGLVARWADADRERIAVTVHVDEDELDELPEGWRVG